MRFLRTERGAVFTDTAGVLGIAVAAFLVIYFVIFPTSSPKPFSLSSRAAAAPISAGTGFGGHWTIASGSLAGYRVREKLAFLPESDAVGGTATLAQSGHVVTVKAATFAVKVIDLKSNSAVRDQRIETIGLQSATYPSATFVLSAPLTLRAAAVKGGVVHTHLQRA